MPAAGAAAGVAEIGDAGGVDGEAAVDGSSGSGVAARGASERGASERGGVGESGRQAASAATASAKELERERAIGVSLCRAR